MLSEVKKNPRVSAKDLQKSLAHANISVGRIYNDVSLFDSRRNSLNCVAKICSNIIKSSRKAPQLSPNYEMSHSAALGGVFLHDPMNTQ
ncbi:hypothetical protein L3Q82_001058 [Scortum barcoo]|uniref:Uncharacterized protein n=1 Tax=Scortum barcoo TaxID=214431 RepID=A0ACB8WAF4_9TELE|nr:hypothetical protein L3Q82_001058 [Scortum barcoo]